MKYFKRKKRFLHLYLQPNEIWHTDYGPPAHYQKEWPVSDG